MPFSNIFTLSSAQLWVHPIPFYNTQLLYVDYITISNCLYSYIFEIHLQFKNGEISSLLRKVTRAERFLESLKNWFR